MTTIKWVKSPIIPNLIYTSKAYAKLQLLMGSTHAKTKEFGFLGLVHPIGPDYLVTDFKLIPQEKCSGVYWESDDAKYPEWLNNNVHVELRKNLRLHGHSHVNMGTSPSGTDAQQIKLMFDSVKDFFIQFICNHNMENTINLWDKKQNLIFEHIEQFVNIGGSLIKITNKSKVELHNNKFIGERHYEIENDVLKINNTFFLNLKDFSVIIEDDYLHYDSKKGTISLTEAQLKRAPEIEKDFKECIKTTIYTPAYTKTTPKHNYLDDYVDDCYSSYAKENLEKEANWELYGYWGILTDDEKEVLEENNIYGHQAVRQFLEEYRRESLEPKKKRGRPKKGGQNESK